MDRVIPRNPAGLGMLFVLLAAGVFFGWCAASGANRSILGLLPIAAVFGFAATFVLVGKPHWVFWLMAVTGLFNDKLFITVGGLNVRAYLGLTALGIVGIVVHALQNRRGRIPRRALRFAIPFSLLFLLIGVKIFGWYSISEFPMGMPKMFPLKHLFFASLLYMTGYVTAVYMPSGRTLEQSIKLWVILFASCALLGFIQTVASNIMPSLHWVHMREVIFYGRAFSVFREPDVFGSVMAAGFCMIFPLIIFKVHVLPPKWLWACLGICGLMLLALFVRAAWLATMVATGFTVLTLLVGSRFVSLLPYIRMGLVGAAAAVALLIVVAPGVVQGFSERIGSLANPEEEGASAYRMQDLDAMIAKFHPEGPITAEAMPLLFGHGDMSWSYWAPYLIGDSYDSNALRNLRVHGHVQMHPGFCMFLAIGFDNGLVGAALILGFFAWVYLRVLRAARIAKNQADPVQRDRILGIVLATALPVLCILVCFQFSYDPGSPFFWILVGFLVVALDQIERGTLPQKDPAPEIISTQ